MFLPRQVQKNYTVGHSRPLPKPVSNYQNIAAVVDRPISPTNKLNKPDIDITIAKEVILALEQLFISKNIHATWLDKRMREIDYNDDYIHFAALLDCPFLVDNKPKLSLVLIRRAFVTVQSQVLQISTDGYHLRFTGSVAGRRRLKDENTIYIEPYYTGISQTPGYIARTLECHLPTQFLPVLFTKSGGKSWAFVTLSSVVTEEHTNTSRLWPSGWKVLTKAEWHRRDNLYEQLRMQAISIREVQNAEYHISKMDLDDSQLATETPSIKMAKFTSGLIVHVRNLHEGANKPTISSFIDRSVDRYVRRKMKKDGDDTSNLSSRANINYIDYTKGVKEAWLRQGSPADSKLIVKALEKRKRVMCDGKDGKCRKSRESSDPWVGGRILEGQEEQEYWRRIEVYKARSSQKVQKSGDGTTTVVDVRHGGKRPRMVSTTNMIEQKKLRIDDDK